MPSFKQNNHRERPQDIGILAIDIYFPSQYVSQTELEDHDYSLKVKDQASKVKDHSFKGKYTVGLGQTSMAFCSDLEDVNSLCLTVLTKLMETATVDNKRIGFADIGYLGVGTETIIDKSKSVKSVLMQLFEESGNYNVEGVDTTNACYGGTAALFNAINWVESSSWDGRFAIVIAADIAVYPVGPARPTGGAGAIAMLIGPSAPLAFETGLRASCMKHAYDFYKPSLQSEYPVVDGDLSIKCYLTALDYCYKSYLNLEKENKNTFGRSVPKSLEDFDMFAFHTPYCKLVQKSFARLMFNDYLNCLNSTNQDISKKFPGLEDFNNLTLELNSWKKDVEKAFVAFSEKSFGIKTKPSLWLASQIGNMYCPSLYGGLISILASSAADNLAGKRIGLFSYGSGFASTLFSIRVSVDSLNSQLLAMTATASEIKSKLNQRIKVSPVDFTKAMSVRERIYKEGKVPHTPKDPLSSLFPGTWYLTEVDEKYRRYYKRVPLTSTDQIHSFNSPMIDIQMEPIYSNGYINNCHETNGHTTNGHDANGQDTNGYSNNGHSINGHEANGHSINGHEANGHSMEVCNGVSS